MQAADRATEPRTHDVESFETFAADHGPRLRRALVAAYGVEDGTDLYGDVMARAWAGWTRIGAMANPSGYLWQTAKSDHRRYRRWARGPRFPGRGVLAQADQVERDLFLSLDSLTAPERVAVVMVHANKATYAEVAEVLDVPVTTVTNLVHRGLKKLRRDLEEAR